MKGTLAAIFLAVALLAAPAISQPAAAPKADAARIARLIAALDSANFAERERATRELLALEGASLEPLRTALAAGPSAEFARRARAILDSLAIYEPGGEIVNGLKIRLTADRAVVKAGETIKLTTTLCNMTDKPLNVMVGYTPCGNYFECGFGLRRVHSAPGKPVTEFEPKCTTGFCGTGAGPIYVTLAPKRGLTYETPVTVTPQGVYVLGNHKYFSMEGTRSADAVRMVLTVAPGANQPRPVRPGLKGEGIRPTDEDAPFWTGAIRSNDLQLKFAP